MPGSSLGIARRSKRAPRPAPCTSSGSAFDSPPAPTSWIDRIGLASPSAQQRSITSCARRWISALPRCTESKSRSSVLAPVPMLEAAPPPMPISMPGPPSWISSAPAGSVAFADVCAPRDVADAAGDHDRLVVAAHTPPTSARRCGSSRRGWAGRTRC
jgi:hypothetical protein